MQTIRLIHNLPRSGGTIISKSLGAQNNVILLSEIHPDGEGVRNKMNIDSDIGDPIFQSKDYYNLFTVEEYRKIKNNKICFEEKINTILKKTLSLNKKLVIRDWAFVDFFGAPFIKPTYENKLLGILEKHYKILNIYILRHPLEMLISCYKSLPFFRDSYQISMFIKSYESFFLNSSKERIIKYEDFCSNPNKNLKRMCEHLEIEFDENYNTKLGDIRVIGDKSGIESKKIYKKENYVGNFLTKDQKKQISDNKNYIELMSKLNNYY